MAHTQKNLITIFVQPDWGAPSKRFKRITSLTVPRRFLVYAALTLVLLMVFGVSGTREIADNITILKKTAALREQLQGLDRLDDEVATIRGEEKIIRHFLGIEAWDRNFDINERMGKGGTGDLNDVEVPPLDVAQELTDHRDRRPLHVRVHDLREDVHELILVLSKMKETLNCRPTVMPVKDEAIWITSGFGWRKSPFTGLREFHRGLDISGRKGAPIIATADGTVSKTGYNRFLGHFVRLRHDDRYSTAYGHLLKYTVKKGDTVKRGQVIGHMGTSGMSTGYHLHYEVSDNDKRVNPYNFILNRTEHTFTVSR